jgi:hypothetical protein
MPKRLIRLTGKELLASSSDIQDRDLNVVGNGGRTYFGRVISNSEKSLVLKDLRGHKHQLALNDIESVIYDQEAPW